MDLSEQRIQGCSSIEQVRASDATRQPLSDQNGRQTRVPKQLFSDTSGSPEYPQSEPWPG